MAGRALFVFTSLLSTLAVGQQWPYMTFHTADYQPPQLSVTKSGAPLAPGYLFIGPRGNQAAGTAAQIYTDDGDLVYQGPEYVTANFRVQQYQGRNVITWWEGEMMSVGFGYGSVSVVDDTYQQIHNVTLSPGDLAGYNGTAAPSFCDLHESQITPQNTLLVTAYNTTQADLTSVGGAADGWLLDAQFYEIDIATNKILFSWSALDHLDQLPLNGSQLPLGTSGTSEEPWDPYHINAVQTTNGGYIISIRHFWTAFYLNTDGSVKWQLNGQNGTDFTLGEGVSFSWQHDIRITSETDESLTLTMFANNNHVRGVNEKPTMGLNLSVDLVNKKVTLVSSASDANDEIYAYSQGSYQPQDYENHVIMGYGSISKVKEYDANGNTVMTAQFGADNAVASYRGYRNEWHATPFWDPALVSTPSTTGQFQIFMSWNGATDYDSWAVYGSMTSDMSNNTLITTAPRNGFETNSTVSNANASFIQVTAMQAQKPLRSSTILTL